MDQEFVCGLANLGQALVFQVFGESSMTSNQQKPAEKSDIFDGFNDTRFHFPIPKKELWTTHWQARPLPHKWQMS